MKKKIGLAILILLEVAMIAGVYVIKGMVAPYIWSLWIFILAPVSSLFLLGEIIVFIVRAIKRKSVKWNCIYVVITMTLAVPVLALFGKPLFVYPDNVPEEKGVVLEKPVKNGIYFGGKDYIEHAIWPSERYAFDILATPYGIKSKELNDYGIYCADVSAPIDGEIIDVKEDEEDAVPNSEKFKSLLGNYIVIRIDQTKTYLILAHLEKKSVKVKCGDHIKTGEIIAQVGNSGTTSEPHLHIQHQENNPKDVKYQTCAKGLPITFR